MVSFILFANNSASILTINCCNVYHLTQVSVIVIDYNHWPRMGDFKFDPISWPDVPGMMNNLTKTYNIPEVIIATHTRPQLQTQRRRYT